MRRFGAEFFCILFVALFIMFFQLGSYPLLDPDEPVYAQTPREMLVAGDLLSPRIYGDYWYDKPPMYYWLVAASSQIFGMGEFAARFRLVDEPTAESLAIDESRDLGWMLYDMDFAAVDDPKPRFFRADMQRGVIDLTKAQVMG